MRRILTGLWATVISALVVYLGLCVLMFFLRDAGDRRRVEQLAREQAAKDYPTSTATDVAIDFRREHGDIREYHAGVTLTLSGEAREAGFACTARHPHFLRWWEPTRHQMAVKAE